MSNFTRISDLETLFLDKLQEKYQLNLRDLKRAFSRFDLDGNGLLDLDEMTKGVQLFLNGVKPAQVQKLVARYDKNGDGKISYDEFLDMLRSRGASLDEDELVSEEYQGIEENFNDNRYAARPPSTGGYSESNYSDAGASDYYDDYAPSGRPQENAYAESQRRAYQQQERPQSRGSEVSSTAPSDIASSAAPSNMDVANPKELEYRAKVFLSNLKKQLLQTASKIRMDGKVKIPSQRHLNDLRETICRNLIMKYFQKYTGEGEGRAREQMTGVEFNNFARVVRAFKFPGASPIRMEVIKFIFDLCSLTPEGDIYTNEEGRTVGDPNILSDLLFGAPVAPVDRKARGLNRLGWKEKSSNPRDEHGVEIKGFVDELERRHDTVQRGPVRLAPAVDVPSSRQVKQQQQVKGKEDMEKYVVPLRFVSRKSHSALAVPSNFNPSASIPRSNQLPEYSLVRKHVFGMCGKLYSGSPIHSLPTTPASFGPAGNNLSRNSPDFIDSCTLVYSAGGTGIVHNLATNSQLFFEGHDDDITCVTVSQDGTYAASGQMGRRPAIYVWPTDIPPTEAKRCIATIGFGFFERGVCALTISWDNKYIVGIGCDDYHMMGVFEIISGKLLVNSPTQHGIPPQIKWMAYCGKQQHTEYITREHAGSCDLFATAGANHLKLWSFRRPDDAKGDEASLKYFATTVRKIGATAPKSYLCCAFIPCDDKSYDFVAGGSNGAVFMWRRGEVIANTPTFRGGVTSMVVCGDKVYCGGAGGMIKALDCRTLAVVQQFALLEGAGTSGPTASIAARPTKAITSGSGGRARSASAGPASRGGTGSRSRTPVSAGRSTRTPTHAAGRANSRAPEHSGAAAINGEGYGLSKEEKEILAANAPPEDIGAKSVYGLAAVRTQTRANAPAAYLIAVLGTGKTVRVDVSNNAGAVQRPGSASGGSRGTAAASQLPVSGTDLFHFHTGTVWGLGEEASNASRLFATVDDHRRLLVWDAEDCVLIAKFVMKNAGRCCALDKSNSFVAVGTALGSISIVYLTDRLTTGSNCYKMEEVAFRKDMREETTDIKFSPSNELVAVAGHDNTICVYGCELGTTEVGHGKNIFIKGTCVLQPLHRLRGHTSYVTHFDWSYDSALIRSTCGAYELICWNVENGRADATVPSADVKWKTNHCVLGFNVMGMWPKYSDGTDINAVDVNVNKGLVVTGDDNQMVRLLNYPCVVAGAPAKEYNGHSSHVLNIRFMRNGNYVMSVGGMDESVVLWEVMAEQQVDEFQSMKRNGGAPPAPKGFGRTNNMSKMRSGGAKYENVI